ncbi:YciI family protein [Spirosoma sp.]|uniref:YciI family protein n=1 Tax=Spirosoma sp. TaxID=1899569 RepID=UPI002629023C|nr:YciI family protein [Spirosoma sp.]MCX6215555.1 YciI family protein [Spirosoma sp.]
MSRPSLILLKIRLSSIGWTLKDGILLNEPVIHSMKYVIHAYDHTDANALARRMAARPDHFAYVRQLKEKGQFILGGALISPEETMIGSMLLLDFDTEEQLQAYLKTDPYIVQGVWEKVDTKPFRQADV